MQTSKETRGTRSGVGVDEGQGKDGGKAVQAPLFTVNARGSWGSLWRMCLRWSLLRRWRLRGGGSGSIWSSLERPINTIDLYMYDLALFQQSVGSKAIDKIGASDVDGFLGLANNKSTRKRRLTSLQGLFRFLVNKEKVLAKNPCDSFFPDYIPLKTPQTLFPHEQEALLDAAHEENSRTYLIAWLLLKLGLTRTELLAMKVDHVDLSNEAQPIVYVYYDEVRWQPKERKLAADGEFADAFQAYLNEYQPVSRLFNLLPQSVNKMIDRVAAEAGIQKRVTPQSLRDTFAVEQAKAGADDKKLLQILGLAPDSRNRKSVQRYIKLAAPPVAGAL